MRSARLQGLAKAHPTTPVCIMRRGAAPSNRRLCITQQAPSADAITASTATDNPTPAHTPAPATSPEAMKLVDKVLEMVKDTGGCCACTHMHTCAFVRARARARAHTHIHRCTHARTHARTHAIPTQHTQTIRYVAPPHTHTHTWGHAHAQETTQTHYS